jgi:putative MFS transporter
MLILNRWIPESPRFLLDRGRVDEARRGLARYGVCWFRRKPDAVWFLGRKPDPVWFYSEIIALFQQPHLAQTILVIVYGLAWGIVNWGFIAFLPTFLRSRGSAQARRRTCCSCRPSSRFRGLCWWRGPTANGAAATA